MNGLDSLPPEIIEKIITAPVSTCINVWPNHMVATFNGFGQSVDSFKSLLMQKQEHMSQVYFSRPDLLPKLVKRKITVNMQRLAVG